MQSDPKEVLEDNVSEKHGCHAILICNCHWNISDYVWRGFGFFHSIFFFNFSLTGC